MKKPIVKIINPDKDCEIIRFDNPYDLFYYDSIENNPKGLGRNGLSNNYINERLILTDNKLKLIETVNKNLNADKDFLDLVHKGKSNKRKFDLNKFCGNLSIVDYSKQSDKIFKKNNIQAKKKVINIAIQVGTFINGNYSDSFEKILKLILSAQALNINLNVDLFDSDTRAISGIDRAYILVNMSKSSEKLNLRNVLIGSHYEFFRGSLFNGYSASDKKLNRIGTFVSSYKISDDLGPYYDVIGGNLLSDSNTMVSKLIKISDKK